MAIFKRRRQSHKRRKMELRGVDQDRGAKMEIRGTHRVIEGTMDAFNNK